MTEIRYTLVTDGSSDRALLPILTWLLHEHCPGIAIQKAWADLRRLPAKESDLGRRIQISLELFPCDLLFVHRDAERLTREQRAGEILQALASVPSPPAVCVVPVRMQEAWLLFDEAAIRKAAGNPSGRMPLELPTLNTVESLPDPKSILYDLLRQASGHTGRRFRRLNIGRCALRVSQFAGTFAPLRVLPAFQALEADLKAIIAEQHWHMIH